MICDECGFDGSRWSDDDRARTLAHADDLVEYVLAGSSPAQRAAAPGRTPLPTDDVSLERVHAVMHHLAVLALFRRGDGPTMVGRVAGLHASGGGVPKQAVAEAQVGPAGIVGDVQANRLHHGRPWQALSLYSADVIDQLRAEGHPIAMGKAGENVTIEGLDWAALRGGLTLTIGDVVCRTSAPAAPCKKIRACFDAGDFSRIGHDRHPGSARWYASVVTGGTIRTGDLVTVTA